MFCTLITSFRISLILIKYIFFLIILKKQELNLNKNLKIKIFCTEFKPDV